MVDEKSKQHVESKQYSFTPSFGANLPASPSASAISGFNFPSRPTTSQHMSPGYCLPTGLPHLEKSETMPEIQMPSMASLDPHFLGSGDQPFYTSTLSYQGNWWDIHSAITDDIIQIYHGVQHCLDLRRKYIRASLQRSSDNPKNNLDHWKIYPPPPPPRWTYNAETNTWQDHKQDIPKLDVGQDFDIDDCEIPGPDPKVYKLEAGVYQVFPDQQCMFSPLAWNWP